MFYDFKKVFQESKKPKNFIPREVLELLNSELPDGLEYTVVGKGICGILPQKQSNFNFQNAKFKLPKECQVKSVKDLIDYMYRTQKSIECEVDKDGFLEIDGNKVPVKDLIKTPLNETKFESVKMKLIPPPFPKHEVKLSANGIEKDVILQRQPSEEDFNTIIRSIDNDIIDFIINFDEKSLSGTFLLTVHMDRLNEIQKILEHLYLLSGFLNKNFQINKIPIFSMAKDIEVNKNELESTEDTIKFWEKIRNVENELGDKCCFSLPLDEDDLIWMKKLYCSFIKKEPYKEYVEVNEIKGEFNTSEPYLDKELSFSFQGEENFNRWNIEKTLYKVVGIFDIKAKKAISIEGGRTSLQVEALPNKRPYIATEYFIKIEDAKSFCKNINVLRDASLLSEIEF